MSRASRIVSRAPGLVRVLVTAAAATVAVMPLVDTFGTVVVAIGAVFGVGLGQGVHRSSVRTAPGVAGLMLFCIVGIALAHAVSRSAVGVDLYGLVGALRFGQLARLAGMTVTIVSVLRFAAARHSFARGIELLVLAAAFVVPFAAHRGGFVARPLWLGDLAARAGIASESALLAVGAVVALALAALLVVEARRRIPPATWIAVPALAVLAVMSVGVVGVPQVEPPADLGLTRWTAGDAAQPHDPGHVDGDNPSDREANGQPDTPSDASGPAMEHPQSDGPGQQPGDLSSEEADAGDAGDEGADRAGDGEPGGPDLVGEDSGGTESGRDDSDASTGVVNDTGGDGTEDDTGTPSSADPPSSGPAPSGDAPPSGTPPDASPSEDSPSGDAPPSGTPPSGTPSSGPAPSEDPPSVDPPPSGTPPSGDALPSGTPTDAPPAEDDAAPPSDPLEPQQELEDRQRGASSTPRPAAVIVLGDDYEPPEQSWYLRQDAWVTFTGNRLVTTRSVDAPRGGFARFPVGREVIADPPPPANRVLVRGTVSALQQHAAPFALASPIAMEPATNPDPTRFVRSWSFESLALAVEPSTLIGRVAGHPSWTAAWWDEVLDGPDDPRWQALANEIILSLPAELRGDPWAQAVAIKLWMDAEVTYSTANARLEGPDPAGDFLFGDRVGYCVHIAHAAVFLMRSLGVPARVGTGYAVPASQRRGSVLIATDADAHAWPEVYLEDVGWVIIDVAPQQVEDAPGEPLDDAVFERLAELARQDPTTDTSSLAPPRRTWRPMQAAQAVLLVLLRLAGLVVVVLYAIKLWRRVAPRYARPDAVPRLAYRAALDMLVEVGMRRAFGEPRARFADRVSAEIPSLLDLTNAHLRAAFRPPTEASTAADARALVLLAHAVRREVAASRPLWRRLLGALDPTSFLRTR